VCAGVLAAGIFRFRLNPLVAGLAFNLAAGGVCTLLVRAAGGGGTGVVRLTGAPLLREAFFVLALLAVVLVHLALRSTVFGFRLRASGLSEEAARESGVDAAFYGAAGWALASCGAALAGAAALFRLGAYVSYGAAGRSWLAIAAVFMGFKRPFLTALAALLFSFAQVASGAAQKSAAFPPPLLNALPYALALVVYALAGRLNTLPPERRVSRQKNAG
jgi:simple sugar transport system permease protein